MHDISNPFILVYLLSRGLASISLTDKPLGAGYQLYAKV